MNFFTMSIPASKYDSIIAGTTCLILCDALQPAFDVTTREPDGAKRIAAGDVVTLFAPDREAFGAQVVDVASYADENAHRFIQPGAVCIVVAPMTDEQVAILNGAN